MDPSPIEKIVRRDRWVVGAALAIAVALCWAWLVPMAFEMEREGMMCGVASWAMVDTWEPGHLAMLFAMWAVMMAGMMLPSAAPTLLLYSCVVRRSPGVEKPAAQINAFAWGYVVAWVGFSIGATVLQRVLTGQLLMSSLMASDSPLFGAAVLLMAGAYQLTPWKRACLARCRSPAEFLSRYWRAGLGGAFRLGVTNGLFCVGCCWALMLLLFVGGVMNLWWIAALTIFVLVEKLAPYGPEGSRVSGWVILAIGGWSLLRAAQ